MHNGPGKGVGEDFLALKKMDPSSAQLPLKLEVCLALKSGNFWLVRAHISISLLSFP